MKERIITDFTHTYMDEISSNSISLISEHVTLKSFYKDDILIEGETKPLRFYIIKTGIVGNFSRDKDEDKEYIRSIHLPKHVFTDFSYINSDEKRTTNCYKCLTDCEVLEGNYTEFIKLSHKHHELSLLYNRILEHSFIRIENRLDRLSLLDATHRYKILKSHIPNIENLIPQYQIAYYLNITPVQLSRIRKKLYSE